MQLLHALSITALLCTTQLDTSRQLLSLGMSSSSRSVCFTSSPLRLPQRLHRQPVTRSACNALYDVIAFLD
jgi:hypothetical protein